MNPLRDEPTSAAGLGGDIVVSWSGWDPADEVGLATWGPRGWSALRHWCDRQAPLLAGGGRELWLRTHAGHVLSDAQRCLTFLGGAGGQPVRLLLDPVSMLAPSMLADAREHLERIMGALAGHEGVRAILLPEECGGPGAEGPLGAALDAHWPAWKPVVLAGGWAPGVRRALTGGAP
ncbi:MAG TPA: hypothetical protein VFF69_00875 [Phycisphaerales bacterium]|nr:hypothetical protein [Phycisphaerales bacterium]